METVPPCLTQFAEAGFGKLAAGGCVATIVGGVGDVAAGATDSGVPQAAKMNINNARLTNKKIRFGMIVSLIGFGLD
jgi:hypothetical protein